MPVGNSMAFYAALKAGANAIYLGLKKFNARGRANNFSNSQIINIVAQAHEKNVKVYVTLNTLIKQNEIKELLETLHFLKYVNIDGVIVQDWGVVYLLKTYFPSIKIHASTQLGIHNLFGANHAKKLGFERVVLARELTLTELENICINSKIETEVFIHGALCYSFSGMCLFSSFAGGHGANRGLCTQPCRRDYNINKQKKFLFNLKDNQQIALIEKFKQYNISSLKIEGRMKSGEYTYRVASAYRMAIDFPAKNKLAKELLQFDFGREKTSYFLGNEIKNAISLKTASGIFLGKVIDAGNSSFQIKSALQIHEGSRLRIYNQKQKKQVIINVKQLKRTDDIYEIYGCELQVKKNADVFLTGTSDIKLPSKIRENKTINIPTLQNQMVNHIIKNIATPKRNAKEELFVRINNLDWLKKIHLNEVDGIILSFTKQSWLNFSPELPFIQKNRNKILIEMPRFIAEGSVEYYSSMAKKLKNCGIVKFVIQHLSQQEILPDNVSVIAGENIYVFNDAANKMLYNQHISNFIYPFEIDFETLFSLRDKGGLVPVYFYPELFYSRMPVKIEGETFSDSNNLQLIRHRRNGITTVTPQQPVSILQFKNKLTKSGFSNFLIDLSYERPSKNRFKTIKNRFIKSEQIQPSTIFNFTKGMQ